VLGTGRDFAHPSVAKLSVSSITSTCQGPIGKLLAGYCELHAHHPMAEDEDGDLLQFLEQLAGNPPSLASGPCTQSGAISCLDAFVPNLTSQSSIRPPPSYRDIREVPMHAQLFATARSVRTPEQILQQLFQQTSRPQMQPLPPHPKRTCVATPLYLRRRMDYEALPGTLVPIQEAILQHEEDSASLQRLPMGQPCPEGRGNTLLHSQCSMH